MTYIDLVGYAAAAAVAATYSMKTMIPLRMVGIGSNLLFIVYGTMSHSVPIVVLHVLLLPLNCWRLYQMARLVHRVREAAHGDLSLEWIRPWMTERRCEQGEVLFRAGDKADAMFYTVTGRFCLTEIGLEFGPGQFIGELGLVTPENRRTLTLECVQAGEMLQLGYAQVRQLYFQNPRFGYVLLRLVSERLMAHAAAMRMELDEPLPLAPDGQALRPDREAVAALVT